MELPEGIDARIHEGEMLRDRGSLDQALAIFSAITAEFPQLPVGHHKLGTVHARLGNSDAAEVAYREALALDSDYPEPNNNLGVMLIARGHWGEAEVLLRRAVASRIDFYEGHVNYADVLQKVGKLQDALYHARRAARIRPESAVACEREASILNSMGRMAEAIDLLRNHVDYAGDYGPYWTTLGVSLQCLGRYAEADAAHAKAIELAPDAFLPRMNHLYFSNYLSAPPADLWSRHSDFGTWLRGQVGPANSNFSMINRNPARRLRVGFVSGDFRRHSVAYFLPGLLHALDRSQFRLYAYSVSHYQDEVTQYLKAFFGVWCDAQEMNHDALYDRIRQDRIDILVDLSGHTNDNRLMVFARRPAPVQISYLGYPNTTGLDVMDFRITDPVADPIGDGDEYHSEALWRLPRCFLCYEPPEHAPDIVPRQGSEITFGSFNSRAKYSPECIELWARVLSRVPQSRLLLKSIVGNADSLGRTELFERFAQLGVAPERIELLPRIDDKSGHLAAYGLIDIALDTLPYNGTTTTCEALWMGVPVVSLRGTRHAGRVGASLLQAVGLEELTADSPDAYVEIAARLATDSAYRQGLSFGLRERMRNSELCDGATMSLSLGDALRGMWQQYCAKNPVEVVPESTASGSMDETEAIRLHIGGREPKEGWKILNIEGGEGVDIVGDVRNLIAFADESCSEIYASHILEHLGHKEVLPVLNELYRMLKPGGKLYVSVPDLETLCWMFSSPIYNVADKYTLMRVIYGGQLDDHDFHHVGFSFDFMVDMLRDAGFESVEHVESLGQFDDMSELVFHGQRISLNLIVSK